MSTMQLPHDYTERVYAGVLGKIIGVYLGRPFEGWSYERLTERFGEVSYYVHEQLNRPLVVTDDDISGTFTFIRALPDHDYNPEITPAQIGWAWRNYIIEQRTILWWGGLGVSTEHTAFLRLKNGIEAPASGGIATNGRVVAEQIGAQIFIDGWGLVCPGDPARAADLARRAASVSHDGEAIHGAQVIAALEAAAFVESDVHRLLDIALTYIPPDCTIRALIDDLRAWRRETPDWRVAREKVEAKYGYACYGGGCHMVPNHAVIILALLYGDDDFQKTLMIANTAGWDTDCNSGNAGCIMGVKNGLAGIDAGPDWRGPVADRLYLPTADGGRCITDAVRETFELVETAHRLRGLDCEPPKDGARFHFSLPGSVQGFGPDDAPEARVVVTLANWLFDGDPSRRGLALHFQDVDDGRPGRVATATFIPTDARNLESYSLVASPTIYSGQTVVARICAERIDRPVRIGFYAGVYDGDDTIGLLRGEPELFEPGDERALEWTLPDTGGQPIVAIGVEITPAAPYGPAASGVVLLDYLSWDGTPSVTLGRPAEGGSMWRRAWVDAVDQQGYPSDPEMPYALTQNSGTGLLLQGERQWRDYTVATTVRPHLAQAVGVVANARGLFRYVVLLLTSDGVAQLVEQYDANRTVLAEAPLPWELDRTYAVTLTARPDGSVSAMVDDTVALRSSVASGNAHGAVGLLLKEGHARFGPVTIGPVSDSS